MKRAAAASAEERYALIVTAFAERRDVEPPAAAGGRFGSNALKLRGGIFAMLVRGEFVVRLPRERVDALVTSREGRHFATGGRVMREWIVATEGDADRWRALADEAYAAARGRAAR